MTTSRVSRVGLAVLAGALLTGCAGQGATVQGQQIHDLYVTIAILAAPVFVGVEGVLLWCIVRYRSREGGETSQSAGGVRSLALFFALPTAIVAFMFIFGEQTLAQVQHRDPNPAVDLRVEGFQWQWTFYYLNAGFFVPEFLFMRNALPGRPNEFTFTPTQIGTFRGRCAEFCGLHHDRMTFVLKVMSEPDYIAWVDQTRKQAPKIDCDPSGPLHLVSKDNSW